MPWKARLFAGRILLLPWSWVMEYQGMQHVLHTLSMVCPDQAGSLQGSHSASCDILAANDLGIGSGWQQSKQNWALPAVVGHWARMRSSDLCCVQGASLHPFLPLPLNWCGWSFLRVTRLAPAPLPSRVTSPRQLSSRIPFGDHPLKLERYRED